ncbi:MAG TPA: fructose-specific PTS transporter subunit EIIC [Bacillota bacterium]|jgi:fructose-specific phosphotransferase system IIC component|nr:hypothetical protein [Bacillota bacterium]HOB86752.1 fructose-specific PTS transporter subunit EIIC [Bacillota bacterium]HOP69906.1 fructose-specific PTS transporter subunit EIIC [Bacillota bacterium]HPT34783.1 fructose-specific PTS transporter subunit EIIC [Bacillota bacterium]HQD06846.1 fructose-specific PTS transporter subunit EIIC [Bacillota bacterium]
MKEGLQDLSRHLFTGVGNMIPVVFTGALLLVLTEMLGGEEQVPFLALLVRTAFALVPLIIAVSIAFSIAEYPAIMPALLCGLIAHKMGTGFLGGIVVGLLVGYGIFLLKKIPFPPTAAAFADLYVLPVATSLAVSLLLFFVIGPPLGSALQALSQWLVNMKVGSQVVVAVVLGAMIAFDMGGPVNKTALTFAYGLFAEHVLGPNTAVNIAMGIPPLGMALACFLAPHKYAKEERGALRSATILGLIGITEGAMPFAVADSRRVIPSIMIGTAVTTGLSAALGVVNPMIMPTLAATIFVNNKLGHLLAVAAGVLTTALLVNLLKREAKTEEEDEEETEDSKEHD